jgi:hypothetical protein
MNIPELTQEQREAIYAEELAKKKSQERKLEDDRKAWKELAGETADDLGEMLFESFLAMQSAKQEVYKRADQAIKLKIELYGDKDQQSHKLSGKKFKVQLGRNATDGHDDTMASGIAKCEEYVSSLIENEGKREIILVLREALSVDKNGKMDSKQIIKLTKLANEIDNPVFTDGVKIILEAYEKSLTSYFVKLERKNELGGWSKCTLSFSGAPFPEGFTTDLFSDKELNS